MHITGIYAALAAILVIILSARVIARRRSARIGIGDGDDKVLARCVRAHGNAIEYLSIGLILLLLVEMNQTQPLVVHIFGIALLFGRLMHAVGLSRSSGPSFGRVGGMILTLAAMGGMAALLIWQFVLRLTI
ncbi:MAPEG family protein [Dokdonella immobilis]|uniref:Glutathione S-transferase n=1 Tax=Dokdonella immobilis TaxID=578942 RepID=A0A1I4WHP6_9GAMM|nr:MAPEG family protein [Dokdonella immobilis]SFN12957.1 hypothetical protein SAMN05216289_10512 [Dokdonella immobilis]